MLKTFWISAVVVLAVAGTAVAADVITVELKDMKLKQAEGITF